MELWMLKLAIILIVVTCDIFAIREADKAWKQKFYITFATIGILFVAQNIILIETVKSIVLQFNGR